MKKVLIFILLIFVLLVSILWIKGLIPKYIAKCLAIQYNNKHTPDFSYSFIEYRDDVCTGYMVYFKKNNGDLVILNVSSKFFPFSVKYQEPIDLPGPVYTVTRIESPDGDVIIYHPSNSTNT